MSPVNLLRFTGVVTWKVATGGSVVMPGRVRWSVILPLFCIIIVN